MTHTTRLCALEASVGKTTACPEDACPFWDAPGGRCAFEQVAATADSAVASWLLEIRERLDDREALRRQFHHLLNESDE